MNDDPGAAMQATTDWDDPASGYPEATNGTERSLPAEFDDGGTARLFPRLSGTHAGEGRNDIGMVLDIPVQLTVELGRTRMPIRQVLGLAQGSVVELEALAGEPLDVLVNGCLIAQGEAVVVNDRFGIRLTEIVAPSERLRRVRRG